MSEEFGFETLGVQLLRIQAIVDETKGNGEDTEPRARIVSIEEQLQQLNHEIELCICAIH
jgi:hypothetical protein